MFDYKTHCVDCGGDETDGELSTVNFGVRYHVNARVCVSLLKVERDHYKSCHLAGHSSLYVTHKARGVDRRSARKWKALAKKLHRQQRKSMNLVIACKRLKSAFDERVNRTRALQQLAAEARRTKTSQSHRIDNTPNVFNVEDVCMQILEALEKLESPWKNEKARTS